MALVAPCGFRCDLCPAGVGSGVDRVRTSAAWSAIWGVDVPPDRIGCLGCHAGACLGAALPAPACAVRACAAGRKLTGCAACPDLPCERLERRLSGVERVAAEWRSRLSAEAWLRFVAPYAFARETLHALRRGRTPGDPGDDGSPSGQPGG